MKQKLLLLIAFLCSAFVVSADELIVENVTIPKGGQGTIVINYHFDVPELYSGWQFSLNLSSEVSTVKNNKGTSLFTAGTCHDESYTITSSYSEGVDNYVALSLESSPITGNDDMLLSIPVVANGEYEVGTVFNASLTGVQFGNKDGIHTSFFDDVLFTITIGEPEDVRVVLDENSTVTPEASGEAVDVKVLRTITAGNWNTICLPFAMTEAQCKSAFGDDVELADFTGYEATEDGDNIVGITVNFTDATAIEANHPYIIKVSSPVSEFTVDGVEIDPAESPQVSFGYTSGTGKNKKYHPNDFNGTYVADFDFYNDATSYPLFLSGNKFYYATENTRHMKAFRAYFDFDDYLSEAEMPEARIVISIDDDPTGIVSVSSRTKHDNVYYDLSGRHVEKPGKGFYIVNGKKIFKN